MSQKVKVANPQNGGAQYLKYSRAMRYVRRGKARIEVDGTIVFLYEQAEVKHGPEQVRCPPLQQPGRITSVVVTQFDGFDAFPGRPILPPSPTVLRHMRRYRGPLVPPLSSGK